MSRHSPSGRIPRLLQRIGWYVDDVDRRASDLLAYRSKLSMPRPANALFTLHPRRAILCAIRGHRFHGPAYVCSWQLQFCRCCGYEIAGRTSLEDVDFRPTDEIDWHHVDDWSVS